MSRNWVTVLCLLSFHDLCVNFVDTSGAVRVVIGYWSLRHPIDYFIDGNRSWLHDLPHFDFAYNVTLEQPQTGDVVHKSVRINSLDGILPVSLLFRKWTGTLRCHFFTKISRKANQTIYTNHFRREIHVAVADGVRTVTMVDAKEAHHRLYFVLRLKVSVACDRYFFDVDCSRHCRPHDGPRGHYDSTRPSRCLNGAVCVEVNGSTVCRCSGPRCKAGTGAEDAREAAQRSPFVLSAALLSAAGAAVIVLVVVGLLCWRRAKRRSVSRPPQPLQVGWRSGSDERIASCETLITLAP